MTAAALGSGRSSGTGPRRLGLPMTLSAAVHFGLVVLVLYSARGRKPGGEVYAVQLIAAAAGPRQIGLANAGAATQPDAPIPKRAEVAPKAPPVRRPPAQKQRSTTSAATQVPDAKSARFDTPAPRAGGGETGGTGTDVANVNIAGKTFAYPGYLRNIVTQIMVRFKPRQQQMLTADVKFVIKKDGSIFGVSIDRPSGSFGFDTEAKGAIEAAGASGAFGPLPDGFSDEVLTVIFTFDPKIIR
jgi:protein TonB